VLPNTTGVSPWRAGNKDFPPIKPDYYVVELRAFEEKISAKNEIYTKITVAFEGENGEERLAWGNLSHNPRAYGKLAQFKAAIGMAPEEGDLGPYIGTRFVAFLSNHEYNGKIYPETVEFRPMDDHAAETALLPKDDLPF